MKALVCEMCGSKDLIKQDGVFVCQHCGTKYSTEEARKMMFEGTVDVSGSTVKIDDSDRLSNLYKLARRAKEEHNAANAQKYYDEIAVEAPDDWEANFYKVYFSAQQAKVGEMGSAVNKVDASVRSTLSIVKDQLTGEEQKNAYTEVVNDTLSFYDLIIGTAYNHWWNASTAGDAKAGYRSNLTTAFLAKESLGDLVIEVFDDQILAAKVYESILSDKCFMGANFGKTEIARLIEKIKRVDPSVDLNQLLNPQGSTSGCYIATAVYGSYDCPEVWTLRRYRDSVLANKWYGRIFIRLYYAVSPTIVKWFGGTDWFNKIWRAKLDQMVKSLKASGIEDSPYDDRQ